MSDKECSESSTSESSSSSSSSETETDSAEKSEAETEKEKDCAEKKSEMDSAVEKSESDDAVEKSESDYDTTKTQPKPQTTESELSNVKIQTNDSTKDCETEKADSVIKKEIKIIKKKDACTQTEEIAVGESAILCTIDAETPEDKIMAWFNPLNQHWDA